VKLIDSIRSKMTTNQKDDPFFEIDGTIYASTGPAQVNALEERWCWKQYTIQLIEDGKSIMQQKEVKLLLVVGGTQHRASKCCLDRHDLRALARLSGMFWHLGRIVFSVL
jgi:hypothetical protein